jgi:Lipid A 3-O-deacylase (PagL)
MARFTTGGFRLGGSAVMIFGCLLGAQQASCQQTVTQPEPSAQSETRPLETHEWEQPTPLSEAVAEPDPEVTERTGDVADSGNFSESLTTPEQVEMPVSDAAIGLGAALGDGGKPAKAEKPHVAQELIIEGLVSYGNYTLWASGWDQHLYTGGIEYDRHSWGHFLRAQMDYVAEFLPLVLLKKPVMVDIYGNPEPYKTHNRPMEIVPGVDISPIGFRWQWFSSRAIKPYLELKGGMIGFTQKVPNRESTYENFSLQSCMGVQVKMNERWGLRLGLFSDFHFSNGYAVPIDPGLDVMNANLGVSYHF